MARFPTVTRLLVGFNSGDVLAYSAVSPDVLPTLLVDNGSIDDCVAKARALGYDVLELGANRGYGGAIMAGLRALASEFVLIANPDVSMTPEDVARLLAAADRYPDADLFAPALERPDGRAFFRRASRLEKAGGPREAPSGDACICVVSGAALLARRAAFIAHGGFDPAIFLYFEDDDLGLRYRREKRAIVYVPEARARHLGNASSLETPGLQTLKDVSFGWSWAHVQGKHGIGNRWLTLARIAATLVLMTLSLRVKQARRRAGVLRGYWLCLRGRRAPYLP